MLGKRSGAKSVIVGKSNKKIKVVRRVNSKTPEDKFEALRSEIRSLLNEAQKESMKVDFDPEKGIDFYAAVTEYQIKLIQSALSVAHGKQKHAAKLLNLNCSTLCTKIKHLNIDPRAF